MADSGGKSDWRRKFSGSSTSSKSTGKDSPRSKHAAESKSSRSYASSTRSSTAPSTSSKLASSQIASVGDGSEGSTPTHTNTTSSLRSNLFRSGRDRAFSNREDGAKGSKGGVSDESGYRGAKTIGRNDKMSRDLQEEAYRKTGAAKRDHQFHGARADSAGASSDDSDDGDLESKRGSVIEKVAQRAKLVLPIKRTKDAGILPGSRLASSSTIQTSLTGGTHLDLDSSDEDDDMNLPSSAAASKSAIHPLASVSSSEATLPSSRSQKDLPGSESEPASAMPGSNAGLPSFAEAAAITRPRTVPPRSTSSDAIYQSPTPGENSPSNVIKSQKIMELSPEDLKPTEAPKEAYVNRPPSRSVNSSSSLASPRHKKPSMSSIREVSHANAAADALNGSKTPGSVELSPQLKSMSGRAPLNGRPNAVRSTSAIKLHSLSNVSSFSAKKSISIPPPRTERRPPTFEPPIPTADEVLPKVDAAPPSGMYWYKAPCYGHDHTAFRAHTTTLVGGNIFVFGGCDAGSCFNDLYVFDADCMFWSCPDCSGHIPPPLRAMTATAVGKKIVFFGGGDGPSYYNDVYVLDTLNFRFTKPSVAGSLPSKRRAHTACFYRNGIYVFGGGDGNKALNDVWRLDVSDLTKPSWKLVSPPSKTAGARPTARGYHTANMVGSKLIVYGGSDGQECFQDVWIFDVESLVWKQVDIKHSFRRLSHSATVVGSYLFVTGGHDGSDYCNDVLLLNLVTMHWDRRKAYGIPPRGRGYHGAVLHDSRLFIIGGFDGQTVFDDTHVLELAICSYYSQISHFTIDA